MFASISPKALEIKSRGRLVAIAEVSGARLQPCWAAEISGQASDSGDTVESSIEAQDSLDTVDLHDGDMDRVSRR